MESNFLDRIREDIGKAKKSKDWSAGIQLCHIALKRQDLSDKDWYFLKNNLALFLMEDDTRANIGEVINIYEEILERLEQVKDPQRLASTHRNLGYVYNEKCTAEDFLVAIKHYMEALRFYTLEKYPEDWILIKSMLGMIYAGLWSSDKNEDYFQSALQNYEDVLLVAKQGKYAVNRREITGLVKELKKQKE